MDHQRRFYIDPATGEFMFMRWDNGWIPSMEPMHMHRAGTLRIYNLLDSFEPTLFTMPTRERWTVLLEPEWRHIRQSLMHPWILDGQATDGLREDQIEEFDSAIVDPGQASQHTQNLLDHLLRPTLFMDTPLRVLTVAPAPAPAPASVPLPRHIADLVLAKAEAEGQTCPITTEPITRQTASITSCGHIFETAAIRDWLQTRPTCPDCRQPCCI